MDDSGIWVQEWCVTVEGGKQPDMDTSILLCNKMLTALDATIQARSKPLSHHPKENASDRLYVIHA